MTTKGRRHQDDVAEIVTRVARTRRTRGVAVCTSVPAEAAVSATDLDPSLRPIIVFGCPSTVSTIRARVARTSGQLPDGSKACR